MHDNELYHYGIKGMKWGVRRYQNKDGTYTKAGSRRYAKEARAQGYDKYDTKTNTYYKNSKKNGRSDLAFDASKYSRDDTTRTKRVVDSAKQLNDAIKNANQNSISRSTKNQNTRMDLSNMTDKELRDRINRELLERQYNNVFNQPQVSKGREFANNLLENAGTALTITSSALGVALAIKELRG